jgi:hypothetical protein
MNFEPITEGQLANHIQNVRNKTKECDEEDLKKDLELLHLCWRKMRMELGHTSYIWRPNDTA